MILDAWFWTGLVIGAVSFVVCVVMTAIRRHPADASILSVAAVELFTLVYAAAAAVRQLGGDTLNGPGWEFWGYILTALIVPVIAVGIPTVVDADPRAGLFLTPRDIDQRIRELGRLLGYGITLALQPSLTAADVTALLG